MVLQVEKRSEVKQHLKNEADTGTGTGTGGGGEIIEPMGVITCHLSTSLHMASIYGRRGLSSNVGNRALPTTALSSACTLFYTSR